MPTALAFLLGATVGLVAVITGVRIGEDWALGAEQAANEEYQRQRVARLTQAYARALIRERLEGPVWRIVGEALWDSGVEMATLVISVIGGCIALFFGVVVVWQLLLLIRYWLIGR
jgi:hypothetical protein